MELDSLQISAGVRKKMCRMLGIYPYEDLTCSVDIVRSFRKLSVCGEVKDPNNPGHPDGWGIVAWRDGKPEYLGREPTDASKDPKFESALELLASSKIKSPLIVHLRKASVGLKTRENTHPFVKDNWSFAHNGTIRRLNLRKGTDSEWFFEELLRGLSMNGEDVVRAVAELVDRVQKTYRYSSMTFLMSNGTELYAYRDYAGGDDYYTMFFARTKHALIFCQEKIFESDWHEVRNGELVIVGQSLAPRSIDLHQQIVRSKEALIRTV